MERQAFGFARLHRKRWTYSALSELTFQSAAGAQGDDEKIEITSLEQKTGQSIFIPA
jgi:hypothetical protein